MGFLRSFLLLVACVAGAPLALAEHRTALLIGDDTESLEAVAGGLGKAGFHCTRLQAGNEREWKSAINAFAGRTPTRGTAFVYFQGNAKASGSDGKAAIDLVTPQVPRGYPLSSLLEALSRTGGSSRNLVFIDDAEIRSIEIDLPEACLVAAGKTGDLLAMLDGRRDLVAALGSLEATASSLPEGDSVSGAGSVAVAPPGEFVLGTRPGDEWVNRRGIVFCWCPAGSYLAGSPEGEPGRYPDEEQREVVIADGFWMSKYELALSQNLRGNGGAPHGAIGTHKLHPLTMVNYDDARAMTQRHFSVAEREAGRLPDGWEYSLCTEAQWEYAARAGTRTAYAFGDDPAALPRHGNFADKSFFDSGDVYALYGHRSLDDGVYRLAKVGSYLPNPWGFHDMHGNVAEWCLGNAVRGGSWVNTAEDCRIAFRHTYSSRNEQNFIGYRIVIRRIPPPDEEKGKGTK